jgi:tetratricopeptide (TPR) repeat protein
MTSKSPSETDKTRVDSWKEIAAFFDRDERTVKRWESERGLPVHRIPGGGRGSVYAFKEELTAWLQKSENVVEAEQTELAIPPNLSNVERAESQLSEVKSEDRGSWNRSRWRVAALVVIALAVVLGVARFIQVSFAKPHAKSSGNVSTVEARREAEDLYLQGRFFWNTRTPEGLTQSVDYFTKATQRDPTYALGYAGLADSYNLLREYTSMPGSEAFPLALAAAKKAIELDDSLPEAHRALAFAEFNWNWDIAGAEREYRRAIELRPTDAQSHHWYATALMELARYKESMDEIDRARGLDPSSKSIAADRGLILYSSGRFDDAVSALKALEKADPDFMSSHRYLAAMYFERKQYENSFAESRILDKLSGKDLGSVNSDEERFKKGGEAALLDGILTRELDNFRNGRGEAFDVAVIYGRLGRKKEALEYLERSYQRHEYVLVSLRNNVNFRFLDDDSQFRNLLKRIGLSGAGRI